MTIVPEGEILRKAVRWVSDERRTHSGKKIEKLVEQACLKFDLPPRDADFLMRYLCEAPSNGSICPE